MKQIPNITPRFYGYDNYPRDEEGKILLDRADDGRIIIKRRNTVSIGNKGLIALCDGAKIAIADWVDLRRGFYLEENNGKKKYHHCIGGSDAGAILGVSSYSSALDIYNAKKELQPVEHDEATLYRFEYGHINEPLVAQGFAVRSKMDVVKNDAVFFNEKTGFMQANVDYIIRHPDGQLSILEIKTTDANSSVYALAKDGKVPLTYYAQAVLHYPMVLSDGFNIKDIYFAVSIGININDIQFCHFSRDPDGEKELLNAESLFVDRLINNTPPNDTATPTERLERLGLTRSESEPLAVELDDIGKAAVVEIEQLSKEKKRLLDMIAPIEKRIGEKQAIICQQLGKATSSTPINKDGKKYTVKWPSLRRTSFDKTVLENKYPDAYKDAVRETISRRFSISIKEKEDKS